ncbi:MAG: YbjN domain-containing protein [Fimbriimonadaceae bacterium]|nr:YbjN domain-containing protein [Fimbriimonadaceae bacterium]
MSIFASAILMAASVVPAHIAQDNPIWTTLEAEKVAEIFEDLGEEVEVADDMITWEGEDGTTFSAYFYLPDDDEDSEVTTNMMLQAIKEGDGSWEAANDWNTMSRNGRAYYSEGTAYFEVDVDADGGISRNNVSAIVEQFINDTPSVMEMILSGVPSSEMVRSVDAEMMMDILVEYGIDAEENDEGDLSWEDEDGNVCHLFFYDDNDLMFQVDVANEDPDMDAINEWNWNTRFGRMYYADSDGVVRIEDDLWIGDGIAMSNLEEFVRRYIEDTLPGAIDVASGS